MPSTVPTAAPEAHSARRVAADASDPRARRTRAAILAAVQRVSPVDGEISVAALCREAGIGRSTFYTHFEDVPDVATTLLRETVATIGVAEAEARGEGIDRKAYVIAAQRRLVDHYAHHRELYRLVFELALPHRAHGPVTQALATATLEDVARLPWPAPVKRPELAARYLAVATTGLLADWVLGELRATKNELVEELVAFVPSWMYEDPRSTERRADS